MFWLPVFWEASSFFPGAGEIYGKGVKTSVHYSSDNGSLQPVPDPGKRSLESGFLTITVEGIQQAVKIGIRLIYLVMGSSVMTLTTTPNQLTDGLERILRPLNRIRVPVHEISMMMSIALRFIPILMEETDKIMKAQIARGADFETGNLIQKAKNMIPLLCPCLSLPFVEQTILPWLWKPDVITEGTTGLR